MSDAEETLKTKGVTIGTKLGNGAFGEVWSGDMKEKKVAIKFMQKITKDTEKEVMNELSLMGNFQNRSILAHIMYVQEIPAIMLEIAEGGSIEDCLKPRDTPIGWGMRMKWAIQISEGLIALHRAGIVHRDLRIPNILLTGDLDVKISDFGVSTHISSKDDNLPFFNKGSFFDSVKHPETLSDTFDCKCFGIVLAQLLLYGPQIHDYEVYDWKNKTITRDIEWQSREEYTELMDLCFHPQVNALKLASFAMSVSAHFFGGQYEGTCQPETEEIESCLRGIHDFFKSVEVVNKVTTFSTKPPKLITAIIRSIPLMVLTQNHSTRDAGFHFPRCLSTLPPKELLPYLIEIQEDDERFISVPSGERERYRAALDYFNQSNRDRWQDKDHLGMLSNYPTKEGLCVILKLLENVEAEDIHGMIFLTQIHCALLRNGEIGRGSVDFLVHYLQHEEYMLTEIIDTLKDTKHVINTDDNEKIANCLLYTSPSPRDA
eukprot:TRINITY_DN3889_c0_g1_i2.p1 TRINITY_DN3889_c0_g1~~TRINITY_DN3889_c0_g1_i2.p1  ORF type:complete len:488 (-),score=65.07 TRINITY_DN3889_c0_g1_i2:11-1474(-)